MHLLQRLAVLLILATLLAPPRWCCAFSECPLVSRSADARNPTPGRACCCACGLAKQGQSDIASIGRPAAAPSECPFQAILSRMIENDPVRVHDPVVVDLPRIDAPSMAELLSRMRFATAAPPPPPPDLLASLCRWRC